MTSGGKQPDDVVEHRDRDEESVRRAHDRIAELEAELHTCQRQCEMQRRQLEELAAQFRAADRRNRELQEEADVLGNLCVANYQLHGSVDRNAVLEAIQEIIINLIGSEEIVVFRLADDGTALAPLAALGVDASRFERVAFGHGIIGRTAQSEQLYLGDPGVAEHAVPGEEELTACLPLRVAGRVFGVIAVFSLMEQKRGRGLNRVDHELLGFLAAHAGTALYCSELHNHAVQTATAS